MPTAPTPPSTAPAGVPSPDSPLPASAPGLGAGAGPDGDAGPALGPGPADSRHARRRREVAWAETAPVDTPVDNSTLRYCPGNGASRWTPPRTKAEVSLVSRSDYLREEIGRIASAASVALRIVDSFGDLGAAVAGETILVGSDVSGRPAAPRDTLVLVGLAGEGDTLWERATRLPAERVAVLPEAAGWLVEYLSRIDGNPAAGHILGIVGGSGGAGASTLACWLAHAAARDYQTLLVDGDEWGGGLDLALGAEELAGIRWPDVSGARGSINPDQLRAALPAPGGFSLLSWGHGSAEVMPEGEPTAVAEVLDAAARGFDLTIVDLPRSDASLTGYAGFCHSLLLVVPARLRAALAAVLVAARCAPLPVSVVVGGPLPPGMDAERLAAYIGHPLGAYWKPPPGLAFAQENGRLLEMGQRRDMRRLTTALLGQLPLPAPARTERRRHG